MPGVVVSLKGIVTPDDICRQSLWYQVVQSLHWMDLTVRDHVQALPHSPQGYLSFLKDVGPGFW
ncbi:hypothetical protein DPMN_154037 [Dreissena polymorpha]|uniref:Uncharacterized protein n=1 Tax=Dreissena polymorpha TaxID=45954 RepID=A0A9D4J8R8_DREPO|nr:hypothetical protein DPMN_154037 [Dreissena polymorpha]